jgi:hypothetical protein
MNELNNELGFLVGPGPCLYSPLGSTTTLGLNRPWWTIIIDPQRRWRHDPRGWLWLATSVGRAPRPRGGHPCCLASGPSPPGKYLLEFSRIFFFIVWSVSLYVNLTCGPPLVLSCQTPVKIDIHQNSWNSISVTPISRLYLYLDHFSCYVDG